MGRLFRILLLLIVAGACTVVGFAFFGDLDPERGEITVPVDLNEN